MRFFFLLLGVVVLGSDSSFAANLLVLNKAEASASLLDLAEGKEIARWDTGHGPHEAAVSPDGKTAVVCNYGTRQATGGSLTVIDLVAREVTRTIPLGKYERPHGIEYFDDGRRVAVTCEDQQALVVVDVAKGAVESALETGSAVSHMVAMTPDETRAFVANIGSGTVTVLDLAAGKKVADVVTGAGAEGIDVSPDGQEVWVSNRSADTVTVLDAATLEVKATLPCGDFPIRVKFTPDGQRVLVSNARTGDVAVFDAATREEITRVSMDAALASDQEGRLFSDQFGDSPVPVGILVEPSGRFAYVANTNADIVTEIDLDKLVVVRRLAAGKEPDGMAWVPDLEMD